MVLPIQNFWAKDDLETKKRALDHPKKIWNLELVNILSAQKKLTRNGRLCPLFGWQLCYETKSWFRLLDGKGNLSFFWQQGRDKLARNVIIVIIIGQMNPKSKLIAYASASAELPISSFSVNNITEKSQPFSAL